MLERAPTLLTKSGQPPPRANSRKIHKDGQWQSTFLLQKKNAAKKDKTAENLIPIFSDSQTFQQNCDYHLKAFVFK